MPIDDTYPRCSSCGVSHVPQNDNCDDYTPVETHSGNNCIQVAFELSVILVLAGVIGLVVLVALRVFGG